MKRQMTSFQTKDEILNNISTIEPLDWQTVDSTFTEPLIYFPDQEWQSDPGFREKRSDTTTYYTQCNGQGVYFKTSDSAYANYYEVVAYEFSKEISISAAPVTAVYNKVNGQNKIIGTVSIAVFTETLNDLDLDNRQVKLLLEKADTSTFAAETVLSLVWRNADWKDNFNHIALGFSSSESSNLYYYVIDRDRIHKGIDGSCSNAERKNFLIDKVIWSKKYINLAKENYFHWVNEVEGIKNQSINRICFGVANDFIKIEPKKKEFYEKLAYSFADNFIRNRNQLKRDFETHFCK